MKSNRFILCCMVFLLMASLVSNVDAFNGRRKGFLLGVGLGPGQTNFGGDPGGKLGINADFKIGHGFSDQTQVYWTAKTSWFRMETGSYYGYPFTHKHTIISGFGGIGVSYFLQPKAPSYYLTGGLGYSTWGRFNSDEQGIDESDFGIGFFSGVGYEFAPHWSVEVVLIAGNPAYKNTNSLRSVWTIKASFNALAY